MRSMHLYTFSKVKYPEKHKGWIFPVLEICLNYMDATTDNKENNKLLVF